MDKITYRTEHSRQPYHGKSMKEHYTERKFTHSHIKAFVVSYCP